MKLTNGRVVIEVRDDKAAHYALFLGYSIMDETPTDPEPVVPEPRKPRGRPRKAN